MDSTQLTDNHYNSNSPDDLQFNSFKEIIVPKLVFDFFLNLFFPIISQYVVDDQIVYKTVYASSNFASSVSHG